MTGELSRRAALAGMAQLAAVASVPLSAREPLAAKAEQGAITSHHRGTFGRNAVRYDATVATTLIRNADGNPAARIVTTSYVRMDRKADGKRPVIFIWGGGPGASSYLHHLHFMGPKRLAPAAKPGGTFGPVVDNPHALLDIADLVFVDPPGTGFSRVVPGNEALIFSVGGDAQAIIALMEDWLATRDRVGSPVYLEGSSYGTVRAIRIGWELRKRRPLAGLFLTANSAMVQETSRDNGVLGPPANLSAMTMTAIYHGKVARNGRSDAQIIDEAYEFGMTDYIAALARVEEISPAEQTRIAKRLEDLTAIPAAAILANNLVLDQPMFVQTLLKDRGLLLYDYYDGRLTRPATEDAGREPRELSPQLVSYLKDTLKAPFDPSTYIPSSGNLGRPWDFSGPAGASSNNWPEMLVEQMADAPAMQLYSANGHYDLLSTMGQARYLFSRIPLPRDRVVHRTYPGGHALYVDADTSRMILADLRGIIMKRDRKLAH